MKCPYCDEEMDEGLVQSGRDIFWAPKKKKMFFIASSSDDIPIAGGFSGAAKESHFCKRCEKIIMDL